MFNNNSMNYYSTSTLKSALLKSYAWMAIALSITAIVSYGLYATNALLILLSTMPFLFMLFVIAPFILSIAFGVSMARSTSSTGMKVMLVLYAICMGVSLTSIGYVYDVATIGTAFLVSAVYFISLAVIGTTSKKDFTSFGSLCMIGLFVLIITQCFMMHGCSLAFYHYSIDFYRHHSLGCTKNESFIDSIGWFSRSTR